MGDRGAAVLFGLWHLVWSLAIGIAAVTFPLVFCADACGFVVGGFYAPFRLATGTLVTPILAHAAHNLTAVGVHVESAGPLDSGGFVASGQVTGYAILAWAVWTGRFRLA